MTRSVAIVGAAGSCGRQLAVQLLDREVLDPSARLQLVAHYGGASEYELHGLRADLRDAFADRAPTIELVIRPEDVNAEIFVMLAGRTVPSDPRQNVDRMALARANHSVFSMYANEFARRGDNAPLVIVQSNPVELGVQTFADAIGRHKVIGAGSYSDTLRFRREIADSVGVRRDAVRALMLGQHGDHLVPVWSSIEIDGYDDNAMRTWRDTQQSGRSVTNLPNEIVSYRAECLEMVADGKIHEVFAKAATFPVDISAAVKPFLVHTTAGHTTEIVTAHAVAEIVTVLVNHQEAVLPLQVLLEGEFADLHGVGGVPVLLGPNGWTEVVTPSLEADELEALQAAFAAIRETNTAVLTGKS